MHISVNSFQTDCVYSSFTILSKEAPCLFELITLLPPTQAMQARPFQYFDYLCWFIF